MQIAVEELKRASDLLPGGQAGDPVVELFVRRFVVGGQFFETGCPHHGVVVEGHEKRLPPGTGRGGFAIGSLAIDANESNSHKIPFKRQTFGFKRICNGPFAPEGDVVGPQMVNDLRAGRDSRMDELNHFPGHFHAVILVHCRAWQDANTSGEQQRASHQHQSGDGTPAGKGSFWFHDANLTGITTRGLIDKTVHIIDSNDVRRK